MEDLLDTKLIFSDETGFLKKNCYYIRTAFIIDSKNYPDFMNEFSVLKNKYKIPRDNELKFNCLWKIKKHKTNINLKDDCFLFKDYELEKLKEFVEQSIKLLEKYKVDIIVVFTFFLKKLPKDLVGIGCDFLKTLMLRLEMEFSQKKSLGIIFYDESLNRNKISKAYKKIFIKSEFIKKYSHIKDSLSFEISRYSAGLQVVDYLAGIIHGFLREFNFSESIFNNHIFKLLRRVPGYNLRAISFIPLYLDSSLLGKKILKNIYKKFKELESNL